MLLEGKEGETKVKCPRSSIMRPGLLPTSENIPDSNDLEYVNRKLPGSSVRDATARAVECNEVSFVSSPTSSGSRQSPNAFESTTPTTPSALKFGQQGASKPNIDEPWTRMDQNRASQDDGNQLWQYRKTYMWSPKRPSPLSPLPRRAFPVRAGGAANNEPLRLEVSSPIHDQATRSRPLCSADFEDSDDEDDISYIDIWEDAGAVPPLKDILQCPQAEMRKIQLLLQAKILREIAELVHEPGTNHRLWGDAAAG